MPTLFSVSLMPAAGKTALTLALGLELRDARVNVGYMKPLGSVPIEWNGKQMDADMLFVRNMLGITDPPELMSPVLLTAELRERAVQQDTPSCWMEIQDAYRALAGRHQAMLVEGLDSLAVGTTLGITATSILAFTQGIGVLVLKGQSEFLANLALFARNVVGQQLNWVVVNGIPREEVDHTRQMLGPFLDRNGMKLLGVIPEDRLLGAVTVAELSTLLDGRFLTRPDMGDSLVQSFAVGAMMPETALRYFMRLRDHAVITGGDRTNIQLAAIETNARCMVLTGNIAPERSVLTQAEEKGIPILLVTTDTRQTMEILEHGLGRTRISNPRQVEKLRDLVRTHLDIDTVKAAMIS